MRVFINQVLQFAALFGILLGIGIALPTTPRASTSLFMGSIKKDSLLQHTPAPRIIFIGGSNLSFGLTSQLVKDSLRLNPINMAIHISIGIQYMLHNCLQYVQPGDRIVLVPEYDLYFKDIHTPSEELLRVILDANASKWAVLSPKQQINLLHILPKYALSKFKPTEYLNLHERPAYTVQSFNIYGDTYTHWNVPPVAFDAHGGIGGKPLNPQVITLIKSFDVALKKKKATLYLSYPGFQASSFSNLSKDIRQVAQALEATGIPILGSPERYKMDDTLHFDTPYHLTYNGVVRRTQLLIQDLKLYVSSD